MASTSGCSDPNQTPRPPNNSSSSDTTNRDLNVTNGNDNDDEAQLVANAENIDMHSSIFDSFTIPPNIETPDDVRRLIREISRDQSLTNAEKNKRYQLVHSHQFRKLQQNNVDALISEVNERASQTTYSTVPDPETRQYMLGCEHYPRKCKLRAACCNAWVGCRHCHDQHESMSHSMNRYETTEIRCMICDTIQPVSAECIKCFTRFARYFCSICKFYDDTPGKDIYHCNRCNICRVGKGIGIDNFHCDTCDACVSLKYINEHRCLKKSLDANCPICGLYIKTSTTPVVFMQCGHTMHAHCFDEYTTEYFTCPLCHKSLANMRAYYDDIDRALAEETPPPEILNRRAIVLCHECDRRCETRYHYLYLKCTHCKGYNTTLIRWFEKSSEQQQEQQEQSGLHEAGSSLKASSSTVTVDHGKVYAQNHQNLFQRMNSNTSTSGGGTASSSTASTAIKTNEVSMLCSESSELQSKDNVIGMKRSADGGPLRDVQSSSSFVNTTAKPAEFPPPRLSGLCRGLLQQVRAVQHIPSSQLEDNDSSSERSYERGDDEMEIQNE